MRHRPWLTSCQLPTGRGQWPISVAADQLPLYGLVIRSSRACMSLSTLETSSAAIVVSNFNVKTLSEIVGIDCVCKCH